MKLRTSNSNELKIYQKKKKRKKKKKKEKKRKKKKDEWSDDGTLFGAVEPDLEVLVPEENRIGLDERIGAQHFRHPVQLIALADVIDFTCAATQAYAPFQSNFTFFILITVLSVVKNPSQLQLMIDSSENEMHC